MIYSIAWTSEAYHSFGERIKYLEIHFTEKEIRRFQERVKEYLEVLKNEPNIGKKAGQLKNVHIGLIIKQVSMVYRIKVRAKEIEIISFIDNRQNP
jgi:plasmid stabilization system protein ParE